MIERPREDLRAVVLFVILLLAGLPIAVWLDLRDITQNALIRQVTDLDHVITGIRSYYADNVVRRVLDTPGHSLVTSNYANVRGAIPIPATFSIELGSVVDANQNAITYRFVSDYPFKRRAPHLLDAWERASLAAFRADPEARRDRSLVTWHGFDSQVRLVAPIIMGQTCVSCHNTHPDSPKRDWRVGDVRGIQEISIVAPIATNLWSFKYLLAYFAIAGIASVSFIALQRRQTKVIRAINEQLAKTNEFLASISAKIKRYISPQIYDAIFSGKADTTIKTQRKKLTIFFSDIKDFTSTTERLQPEELADLLGEYLTEMANIALAHGGTVDKFVGDAILVFFGDPTTRGVAEDAKAALRMAVAMQQRIGELSARWRRRGIERPFRVRMGINTGYCNVGNFGSADRMDYTIVGAEVNLTSRLESMAEPGTICLTYETFALVRDIAIGHALDPIAAKGISHDVVPYVIDGLIGESGAARDVISEHRGGLDLYLDLTKIEAADTDRVRSVLRDAMTALDERPLA
jgi:adenylate cyclase